MKNKSNLFKRIRNIIVGNTLPKNEDLWLDTSNGEKNAVLKYKGNAINGGGGGSNNPSNIGILVLEQAYNDNGSVISETVTINGQSFSVSNNSLVKYKSGEGVNFSGLESALNIDLFLETSAIDLLHSFDAIIFKINSLNSGGTISISGVLDYNMNYIGVAIDSDVSWVPTVILRVRSAN